MFQILVTDIVAHTNGVSIHTTVLQFETKEAANIAYSHLAGDIITPTLPGLRSSRDATKLYAD